MPASARTTAANTASARPYGGLAMAARGICAAAGLTDRYFYESFASLEALLAEVYRTLKDGLAKRLTEESFGAEGWHGDEAAVERQVTAA